MQVNGKIESGRSKVAYNVFPAVHDYTSINIQACSLLYEWLQLDMLHAFCDLHGSEEVYLPILLKYFWTLHDAKGNKSNCNLWRDWNFLEEKRAFY